MNQKQLHDSKYQIDCYKIEENMLWYTSKQRNCFPTKINKSRDITSSFEFTMHVNSKRTEMKR